MEQEAEDTRVVQELRSKTKTYGGVGDCGNSGVSFVTETQRKERQMLLESSERRLEGLLRKSGLWPCKEHRDEV